MSVADDIINTGIFGRGLPELVKASIKRNLNDVPPALLQSFYSDVRANPTDPATVVASYSRRLQEGYKTNPEGAERFAVGVAHAFDSARGGGTADDLGNRSEAYVATNLTAENGHVWRSGSLIQMVLGDVHDVMLARKPLQPIKPFTSSEFNKYVGDGDFQRQMAASSGPEVGPGSGAGVVGIAAGHGAALPGDRTVASGGGPNSDTQTRSLPSASNVVPASAGDTVPTGIGVRPATRSAPHRQQLPPATRRPHAGVTHLRTQNANSTDDLASRDPDKLAGMAARTVATMPHENLHGPVNVYGKVVTAAEPPAAGAAGNADVTRARKTTPAAP